MTNSEFRKMRTDENVREIVDHLQEMKSLSLEGSEITDATMELIAANCFELKELSMSDTMISDRGLQYVGKLPTLNWLSIDNELATDKALRRIVALPALKGLHLVDTNITDDGFSMLNALHELAYLEVVTRNEVGIEGLRSLTNKDGLEYLRLSAVKIGEDKFSQLVLGTTLRSFCFEMPAVSEVALNELNKKFPTCHIHRYGFQRSGLDSWYESAMRSAIARSPAPTTRVPGTEKYLHTDLRTHARPVHEGQATNKLTRDEIAMLIERGLLHPDFYKYDVSSAPYRKSK